MESRPERGVVGRLMWEAAAVEGGADNPDSGPPAGPAPRLPAKDRAPVKPQPPGDGPGSKIRRYSPEPRPAPPAKPKDPVRAEPAEPSK